MNLNGLLLILAKQQQWIAQTILHFLQSESGKYVIVFSLVVHWRPICGLGLTFSSRWFYFLFDKFTILILVTLTSRNESKIFYIIKERSNFPDMLFERVFKGHMSFQNSEFLSSNVKHIYMLCKAQTVAILC